MPAMVRMQKIAGRDHIVEQVVVRLPYAFVADRRSGKDQKNGPEALKDQSPRRHRIIQLARRAKETVARHRVMRAPASPLV